ncbi:MAG: hypothetical protein IT287_06085 [Bdellovibrionaceae bacterium]|nr:hypothetical protein [Pseudobdellovibrionaceae bacterium]
MATKPTATKNHLPRAYAELLSSIGVFMQYWGFKEVHGQVWTCVYLAEEPIDAAHIISKLKLSKAAVSLAIKDLLEYKVIQELEKTKPSTRRYISNPDLADVILNVLRFREKQMLNVVVSASKAFLESNKDEMQKVKVSREKLKQLKEMSEGAQMILEQILREDDVELTQFLSLLQLSL